jgi:hypothetical protein
VLMVADLLFIYRTFVHTNLYILFLFLYTYKYDQFIVHSSFPDSNTLNFK